MVVEARLAEMSQGIIANTEAVARTEAIAAQLAGAAVGQPDESAETYHGIGGGKLTPGAQDEDGHSSSAAAPLSGATDLISRKRIELQAAISVAAEAKTFAHIAAHAMWVQLQGSAGVALPPRAMSVRVAKRLAALYPTKTPIGSMRSSWSLQPEETAEELGLAINASGPDGKVTVSASGDNYKQVGCAAKLELCFSSGDEVSTTRFSDENARKTLDELLQDRGIKLPDDMHMGDSGSKSEDVLPISAQLNYTPRRIADDHEDGDGESKWSFFLVGAHRRLKDGRHRIVMVVENIVCSGRLGFPTSWKGVRPKGVNGD